MTKRGAGPHLVGRGAPDDGDGLHRIEDAGNVGIVVGVVVHSPVHSRPALADLAPMPLGVAHQHVFRHHPRRSVISLGKLHPGLRIERLLPIFSVKGFGSNGLRVFGDDLIQVFSRHHPVDQAEPGGGGIDRLAVSSISMARLRATHVARQRHHGAGAEQADVDAGVQKADSRGDRQIAARHELEPGGGGDSSTWAITGFFGLATMVASAPSTGEGCARRRPCPGRIGAVRGQLLEVVAGAEHLAGCRRQHHHAHGKPSSRARRVRPSAPP